MNKNDRVQHRTQNHRAFTEYRQPVQNVTKQMHAFHGQGLDFIKNQHRIGHRVDMPRAARTAAEPSIQKLHHRGKYNGLIPIFGQQFVLPALLFGF